LPDREMATVEAWLAGHPDIRVLSRDRGGGYGEAASKALPCVIQVADRWHLMENASSAFLSAVRKSKRPIRAAIGATTINPELLTCAERLQYEGYCDVKRPLPRSWRSPRTERQSSRSFAKLATVETASARSFEVIEAMYLGRGKARSMHVCRSSMPNGPVAVATLPDCGDSSNLTVSAVPSGWSASGRPGVGALKRPAINNYRRSPRLARSHG